MTTKNKKAACYIFDLDLFVAMPGKREAAVALYEALTYLASDPPQYVADDPQRCGNWPEEWFFIGAWPESARTDLVRDLAVLLGEDKTTVSKRLLLLGDRNLNDLSGPDVYRVMYDQIKDKGYSALTLVCARPSSAAVNRKMFHNVISLT